MNHGLSPLHLSNLLPLHVGELSAYRLQNAENYVGIYANTRAYADSFLPSTVCGIMDCLLNYMKWVSGPIYFAL